MSIKNRLESVIRGWFPKEPIMPRNEVKMAETKVSKPKPWWWKPYWIIVVIATVALGLVLPLFTDVPMERAVIGLVPTVLCVGFAYYIRVRPSLKLNRALYILLGITPIGFVLWVICVFVFNRLTAGTSGTWPFVLVLFVVCFGLGAFIGDWIGKRRNYILPMTP